MSDPEQNSPVPQSMVSQLPPPPLAQPGYNSPATSQRPSAATAIGIILIVLGGFSVLGILVLIVQHSMASTIGVNNSGIRLQQLVNIVEKPLYATLFFVLGVGLLRMASWARQGTIVVLPTLTIISTVIEIYLLFAVAYPTLLETYSGSSWVVTITLITAGVIVFFKLVMYGLFIFFLTRAEVAVAFERR